MSKEKQFQPIKRDLFLKFRSIAYEKAGIDLQEEKRTLVTTRIAKRQRALDILSPKDYLAYLEADKTGVELVNFINVISTNHTGFFREPAHFEFLAKAVKVWLAKGQRKFRFWSAASSSGEEPYSMAIAICEAFGSKKAESEKVDFKILASDISTKVLMEASRGYYEKEKVKPLNKHLRSKYFQDAGRRNTDTDNYQAKPVLREKIVFKRINLSQPPFPMCGPFDAVFCRNVMIYFDQTVRQSLIDEISRLLRPGGCLMIGHSESLNGLNCNLKAVRPATYVK